MVEILDFIAKYGTVPVIIGALIYLIYRIVLSFLNRREKKQEAEIRLAEQEEQNRKEHEQELMQAERDKRMIEIIRDILQGPKHTVEEQRESRKINQFIVNQLNCLIQEGADRSYMFSFHNGGTDVLGRGFLKMSMTAENVRSGVVTIMGHYQNMPRMLFPHLYEELAEHDFYNVDDIDVIKESDPCTYQFLVEHGVKNAMFRAIKREDGLMIGFIGMEYITNTCDDFKKAGKNIDKKVNRIIGALLGQGENQGGNQ